MIDANTGSGARADPYPGLHARVSGHETPVIKQSLNLAVLPDGWLLRHQRLAGLLEQLAHSIPTRTLVGHQPHTAAGCAESALEPVRERKSVEIAIPADEPPSRLSEPDLVEQAGELDLALDAGK
jgi:hypothetical protein